MLFKDGYCIGKGKVRLDDGNFSNFEVLDGFSKSCGKL